MASLCGRGRRWQATAAAAVAVLGLVPASAFAQQDESPLRFLKPWLERQIYGDDVPQNATPTKPSPDAETAPESAASPASPDARGAAVEPPTSPESPAPDSAVADPTTAPPPVGDAGAREPASDAATELVPGAQPELPAVSPEHRDPPQQPLRFAVLAGRSVAEMMKAVGPVADDLERALGRAVEILPMTSYRAMTDAQTERRVDGGFYSAAAYAFAEATCDCLEPLVAPKASDATLSYHAIIVTRANAGIASIADLNGKKVAVGMTDSIGARRMQLAGLLREDINPAGFFGAVLEFDSAEAATRALIDGSADAAFAWSSLSGSEQAGYSRGTLTNLVADGDLAMGDLAIIWRSSPIAHGPFAVLSTLPEADRNRIEAYLLALNIRKPVAYDMLNPFYGGGYAPVDPQDYDGIAMLTMADIDAISLPTGPPQ
jgi:phosphonate transport system substrate-binding protein